MKTFRHEVYKEYKANRQKMPEELEKSAAEKAREIEYQKYYTGGSIVLMFLVLIAMYFVLK